MDRRSETTLARAGAALGVGGAVSGLIWGLFAALGGAGPAAILGIVLIGGLVSAAGLTALAAPLWLVLHLAGRRGLATAMALGALLGFVLLLGGQTHGFGLGAAPPADAATWGMRWLSAAATSLGFALIGSGVAALMWWVAYRG
ncbi:MAG: hypothetical protein A4S12_02085 [Proteobacteria bacterium SG_bin5]|nr:hypothetical protein [Sphingomonas sp.]OQW39669.1 MAG: hypothetical protein A4S12_02085 [Proteobacteria bacterium SG_bin5]